MWGYYKPYVYQNQITGAIESIDTINITVMGDDVVIDKVTANHGRCQLNSSRTKQYPKTYQYGDVIENSFIMVKNRRATKCTVLSVEVTSVGVVNTYEF